MKQRHVEGARQNARATFRQWGIDPSQDFFTLSSEQVCHILESADRAKYRKPRNANGSRGRYFYQLMQRRARD